MRHGARPTIWKSPATRSQATPIQPSRPTDNGSTSCRTCLGEWAEWTSGACASHRPDWVVWRTSGHLSTRRATRCSPPSVPMATCISQATAIQDWADWTSTSPYPTPPPNKWGGKIQLRRERHRPIASSIPAIPSTRRATTSA